jgi:shikimate kinase
VRAIESGSPTVLALGGGAYTQPGNFELVRNNGVTVWLDCPLETVKRRVAEAVHRPLARDPARFERLYWERHAAYGRADFRIGIGSDDPAAAVAAVLELPIF